MLNVYEYEAKTEEDAKEKALRELNLSENQIFSETTFQEGKLFKGSKYQLKVVKKEDILKFIEDYNYNLGQMMGLNINSTTEVEGENFNVMLDSNNNSILIGKDGRTLNSLQIIIRQAFKKMINCSVKINLDVSGYKEKKLKKLAHEVKKYAREVKASGIEVSLDPMNSYERRYVHSIISEIEGVETSSVGEGRDRHIVIKKTGE